MSIGLKVERVTPESIAAEVGMESGDKVIAINGRQLTDVLDYRFLMANEKIELKLAKANGEQWLVDIEKDPEEDLGAEVEGLLNIRPCGNKCLFCFVDQMPAGMRDSLYVKDDDYRHSFLFGNFITLTNVSDAELQRIADLRLSPLYISVHTTNPILRQKMMGTIRAAEIMEQLSFLARHKINMHTQVVLCPGENDGEELERTIEDLAGLWPQVKSLAVVPVGLTGHRQGLAEIGSFSRESARETLALIERTQQLMLEREGSRFVFAADEFYLRAGKEVPLDEEYEGYPQLENGVGLVRQFLDQWQHQLSAKLTVPDDEAKYFIGTGQAAAPLIRGAVVSLAQRFPGLDIKVVTLDNYHFGGRVTVTGLITGRDVVMNVMQKLSIPDRKDGILLLPDIMLKEGTDRFLDDLTVEEVTAELDMHVKIVETHPQALLEGLGFGGIS
ncbi:DUF512 domain-containing protein [Metallumcola ferriviriculae]|uniref:DUF512 domain-containing protein n=1 Tax=Metallumcola ferriviriculae TaxID=3039180 RepID=A0AAU0UQW0_9FIRM|nr:DUF512 domain-containing protein [Desulfitibacteraceae bacterium MK1]